MAFFQDEPAAEEVEKMLLQAEAGRHKLMMSAVNWGEIYYSVMRADSRESADRKAREIAGMAIEIVPVKEDLELVREAAVLKATYRLAYADCFAAALARLRNAVLVTGDPEFKALERELRGIHWLKA
jgi:ribonuclease VapC